MVMRHIIVLLSVFCISCGSTLPPLTPSKFRPYQMDIQQGNVVTSKMMMQLRPGMTRSQVRYIMGSPLIQDSFHANRWDYFYQMRHEGRIIEQRRVILEFENDVLARVRGDVIPAGSGQQDLATEATTPESLTKKAPVKKQEKSLADRLMFWKSDKPEQLEDNKAKEQLVAPLIPETGPVEAPQQVAPARIKEGAAPSTESGSKADAPPKDTSGEVQAEKSSVPDSEAPEAVPTPDDVEVAPMGAQEATTPRELPVSEPESVPVTPAPTEAAPPKPVPVAPVPVETSEPSAPSEQSAGDAGASEMDLIMDYNLNLPTDAGNPSNVSNPSQAPDADLPSEASPDFFERMLEKIGF